MKDKFSVLPKYQLPKKKKQDKSRSTGMTKLDIEIPTFEIIQRRIIILYIEIILGKKKA